MIPAQITITADQLRVVRDFAEPIVLAVLVRIMKSSIAALKRGVNDMVTENSNRNRDELIVHIDRKFVQHESTAFARIDILEKETAALQQSVAELTALIRKYQSELTTQNQKQ